MTTGLPSDLDPFLFFILDNTTFTSVLLIIGVNHLLFHPQRPTLYSPYAAAYQIIPSIAHSSYPGLLKQLRLRLLDLCGVPGSFVQRLRYPKYMSVSTRCFELFVRLAQ